MITPNLGGGAGRYMGSAAKFHLAVYRLVKDPALKQASGLCSIGSKWVRSVPVPYSAPPRNRQ